ncbi:MAG: pyridoxal-phosphate dependent enzyme [Actinomycetota bacterium]
MRPDKIELARVPTPLEPLPRLQERWGGPNLWVKRDDLTGFELSGNKVRKLEYHLAAAKADGADWVITAGAVQSNHCRATALACARIGLGCTLLIRTEDGRAPDRIDANHAAHVLSGAEIVYVDRAGWAARDETMAALAAELAGDGHRSWIIPAGASDSLGMLGMADAMLELGTQLFEAGIEDPVIWHASSSAGTTAGFGWGLHEAGLRADLIAVSVGEPPEEIAGYVEAMWRGAAKRFGGEVPDIDIEYRGDFIGAGYGLIDPEQPGVEAEATALTGLLFDPTYTGKALFGLRQEIATGRWSGDDHVIFWHTGGGFAALR